MAGQSGRAARVIEGVLGNGGGRGLQEAASGPSQDASPGQEVRAHEWSPATFTRPVGARTFEVTK